MRSLQAIIVAAILMMAALSFGGGMAIEPTALPKLSSRFIIHQVGDADGFGFGVDVCPISCELPKEPTGGGDPEPVDAPESPCAHTRTWAHNITSEFPTDAEILSAVLMLSAAVIQPDIPQASLPPLVPTFRWSTSTRESTPAA